MQDVTHDRINQELTDNSVVLYMKGTAVFPQCGFSAAVIEILDREGVGYKTLNVLEDPDVRDGIKTFSDWPTIPQLYVGGEFVGGCDIVTELYGNGELATILAPPATE